MGSALAFVGLRLGVIRGWPFLLASGGLVWQALSGGDANGREVARHLNHFGAGITSGIYDHAAQAAKEQRHPAGALIEDVVEEASDDSFPCSDPPAWTARG